MIQTALEDEEEQLHSLPNMLEVRHPRKVGGGQGHICGSCIPCSPTLCLAQREASEGGGGGGRMGSPEDLREEGGFCPCDPLMVEKWKQAAKVRSGGVAQRPFPESALPSFQ